MAEDGIRYSDIITPDDSIDRLIKSLEDVDKTFRELMGNVRTSAANMSKSLKDVSGATSEGRKEIDAAAVAAERLAKAEQELAIASTEAGKQTAYVKAQTAELNRESATTQKFFDAAAGSYAGLNSELKLVSAQYKALSKEQRENSKEGATLLNRILELKKEIAGLDAQMKPYIEKLSRTEKLKQKIAYYSSQEGKAELELKKQLAGLTAVRKEEGSQMSLAEKLRTKLAFATSAEGKEASKLQNQINKLASERRKEFSQANQNADTYKKIATLKSQEGLETLKLQQRLADVKRVRELEAKAARTAEGSYQRLSAEYELQIIKINRLSAAQRASTEGQQMVKNARELRDQMRKMQEEYGDYRLSVGNYGRAWDGLGFSIAQVVRELPAAAVSLNTFFLGISNNLPLVADEIARVRKQNELLAAQGEPTRSVIGQIVKSLFSWNTALILVVTALSLSGDKLEGWVKKVVKGRGAALSMAEATRDMIKELENTTDGYGDNIVKFQQLQREWSKLTTLEEQLKWIKENKSEFEGLRLAIEDTTDAENAFVKNTRKVMDAFKYRAQSAAAKELAEEKYEEELRLSLQAQEERNKLDMEGPSAADYIMYGLASSGGSAQGPGNADNINIIELANARIASLEEEAEAAKQAGDAYFELMTARNKLADESLGAAGLSLSFGDSDTGGRTAKGEREKEGRDLLEWIESMRVKVRKKYAESEAALPTDEFYRRRTEASAEYVTSSDELTLMYERNERILKDNGDKYKKLTDEQRATIEESQAVILETLKNYQTEYVKELKQIDKDERVAELEQINETFTLRAEAIKKGSKEEYLLLLEANENARQLALARNEALPVEQRQNVSDINAVFDKKAVGITTDYKISTFDQIQAAQDAEFNAVSRSENAITRFKLEQEKKRWVYLVSLAKKGALDWSEEQVDAALNTIENIDLKIKDTKFIARIAERGLGGALLESLNFDDNQIDAYANAADIVVGHIQEIIDAEVTLAEKAVEAAQMRVDAAKSALDAEIEARNNGYANNVATAKKELEEEKKRQEEKQRILEKAQKAQAAIDSVTQTTSLITATALLWKSFAGTGPAAPFLAGAAIAAMWTSFAAAKVKAAQVSKSSTEEYGEGGLEFLEGGSHASGNDIDLGIKNKRNRRMKAEGGEAMAIISRKSTRKYRKVLPDIVESLNKGIFEDKYVNAFAGAERYNLLVNAKTDIDLSKIEDDVRGIRKQNETRYYSMPNGNTMVVRRNVKRIIKNS